MQASKDGFGTLDAALLGNVVLDILQVSKRLGRKYDVRLLHRAER